MLYKKGVKLFFAAAMAAILVVGGGSRAFVQAAPRLNAHATDSGTNGSVQWSASLVAAGNTVTGRTSSVQSARDGVSVAAYGTNSIGEAEFQQGSGSGQSYASATVSFGGTATAASSTHTVHGHQVAALSIGQ